MHNQRLLCCHSLQQTEISPSDMLEAIDEVREAVLEVKSTAVTTQELQQQVKDALAAAGGAEAVGSTSPLAESDMKTVKVKRVPLLVIQLPATMLVASACQCQGS